MKSTQRERLSTKSKYLSASWVQKLVLSPVGQDRKKTVGLRDYQKRSERNVSIVEKHQVILQMKQS